jgi:hypothetical protein
MKTYYPISFGVYIEEKTVPIFFGLIFSIVILGVELIL